MKQSTTTQLLLSLWRRGRKRFSDQLGGISERDLTKKLPGTQNSVGFLIRHIGEVELMFAKNTLGGAIDVYPLTLMAQRDTGEWTKLDELLAYVEQSGKLLETLIASHADQDWDRIAVTNVGSMTLAEALGGIISHTAHHGGQMALILKYAP